MEIDLPDDGVMERVRFKRPPVVEVVCGVQFSVGRPLSSVEPGLYWQTIKDRFPRVEDVPPLTAAFEAIGPVQEVAVELMQVPPLRRAWFLTNDGSNLIQLQGDRFIFNWKRAGEDSTYPSYDVVIKAFEKHLAGFEQFVEGQIGGKPVYRQFELTYVNHIDKSNGLDRVGEGNVLIDHTRVADTSRFLKDAEGYNLVTTYLLPNSFGRLRITAQTALREPGGERLVRLDMSARGISGDTSSKGMRAWFDVAHDWITFGFADITSPILQKDFWERVS
jgi:uncharacterized protein (TIGR04255 family)